MQDGGETAEPMGVSTQIIKSYYIYNQNTVITQRFSTKQAQHSLLGYTTWKATGGVCSYAVPVG